MPNNHPPESRRQMDRCARHARRKSSPRSSSPPRSRSRVWVRRADLDDGRRADGLTLAEKDEPARLRREVQLLREEAATSRPCPRPAACRYGLLL